MLSSILLLFSSPKKLDIIKIFFKVIQRILSNFSQFLKLSGFNKLCELQKYQIFMNYVNLDKAEILYCIKVLHKCLKIHQLHISKITKKEYKISSWKISKSFQKRKKTQQYGLEWYISLSEKDKQSIIR